MELASLKILGLNSRSRLTTAFSSRDRLVTGEFFHRDSADLGEFGQSSFGD